MGSNRRFSEKQSPSEVFGRLSNNFSDEKKLELYNVWKAYNELRSKNVKPLNCIEALYGEDLDYFTSVGFELFNREYIEGRNK